MLNRLIPYLFCCFGLLLPTFASASAYNIEVILFERYSGGGEAWTSHPGSPNFGLAKANLSKSSGGGARLVGGKSLGGIANTLRKKGMKVHAHLRWQQQVPKRNNKSWYRIGTGSVGGIISVSRGHYLHLNTDLLIRHKGSAYRVKMGRRMRSGELHYLDHPKIGIITIAERVRSKANNVETTPIKVDNQPEKPEPSEPKPATENSIPRSTADRS